VANYSGNEKVRKHCVYMRLLDPETEIHVYTSVYTSVYISVYTSVYTSLNRFP
jgi:hypothetical protein